MSRQDLVLVATRALLDRAGNLVVRPDLEAVAWRDGTRSARTLDTRIKVLRRRVAPLGLRIHAVRGTGFTLDV